MKISTRDIILSVILLKMIYSSVLSKQDEESVNSKKRTRRRNQLEHVMDFRIVGGIEASIKDFPYMISLQVNSHHICGGSIITKSFILTAAHCVINDQESDGTWTISNPLELNIVAGQTVLDLGESQFRDVKKIFVHSDYNHTSMRNDIAILEIFEPLEWTKYTQVAELFSKVHSAYENHDFCTAIGWGSSLPMKPEKRSNYVEKNVLQQVDLQPSLRTTCERFFAPAPHLFDSGKLCVIISEEKDACVGDSGGPFICNGIQYGITSFGLGCAQLNMPGVFTNISAFHDWIYGVLNNTESHVVSRKVEIVNLTRLPDSLKPRKGIILEKCQSSTKSVCTTFNILCLLLVSFLMNNVIQECIRFLYFS